MLYIKSGETLKMENLNTIYYQRFLRSPMINTNRSLIMELITSKKIDENDLSLLEFVFDVATCTKGQLERFARMKGINNLDDRLPVLLDNLLLNSYVLVEDRKYKGDFPVDAEVYFCIHSGGKHILDSMSDVNSYSWENGDQVSGSKRVIRTCAAAEITLRIKAMKFKTETVSYPHFRLSVQNSTAKPLSAISTSRIKLEEGDENIIIDAILDTDIKFNRLENLSSYSQLLATNTWKKYFGNISNVPILFLIVFNEENALECSKHLDIISNGKFTNYMFITFDELVNASEEPPYFKCLKYDKKSSQMVEFEHYLFS